MKTIETVLFSFSELSEDAKQRIIAREGENVELDYSDIRASLKAVCDACNLRLVDYAYGPYCRNHKVCVSGNTEEMEGNKALAWFLQILISHGYARPARFAEMTFPGVCGFTGICYDEDIVQTIWGYLRDGSNVRQAFDGISGKLCELCGDELEYQQSEECILDYLDTSTEIYTEDGDEF